MDKNKFYPCLVLLFLLSVVAVTSMAPPVKADQDSSGFPSITIESYTYNGVTTPYASGSIPVGATIDFRVWVDLYNNDPVRIGYGDGATDSYSFGGSFSHDFYHAYTSANIYVAEAFMPTDYREFTAYSQPLTIGGSSGAGGDQIMSFVSGLDPTQLSVIVVVGFVAIALIAGGIRHMVTRRASGRSSTGKMGMGKAGTKDPRWSQPTTQHGPTYSQPAPSPSPFVDPDSPPESMIAPGGTPLGGAGAYAMPVNQGRVGVQNEVRKCGVGNVWGNGCIDQPDQYYNVTITTNWDTICHVETYTDHFFVTFSKPAPPNAFFDWIISR